MKPVVRLVNPVTRLRQSSRTPILQVVKTAVAVVAAVLLCTVVLPGPFPTFGAIAALLVVQPSINQSFVKGLERSAGVVLGVLLSTGLHLLLGDATWVVLLAIVVAILVAWALRLTPTSATQVAISGMLVLTAGVVTPHYSLDRIIETVLGAVVALVVNALIVPPVLLQPAHLAVARLARDTAVAFERIAVGLTEGASRAAWDDTLVTARTLRQTMARADAAIAAARESLTMNPRGSRNRTVLERDVVVAGHLSVMVTRVIGMTRAIRDNVTPDLLEDLVVGRIATEVARIAVDVRALGSGSSDTGSSDTGSSDTGSSGTGSSDTGSSDTGSSDTGSSDTGSFDTSADAAGADEPALTTPIAVVRPNPDHWILIGSLLEDIRRVREELLGGAT